MNSLQTIINSLTGSGGSAGGALEFLAAIIFSALLGGFYIFLYRLYFESNEPLEVSVYKSFILLAPTVTAIFWIIQFSLPLSLGLLGALSFVRFRTPIKRSEDIGFILLVIVSGLASATYRFEIAAIFAAVLLAIVLIKKLVIKKGWWQKGKSVSLYISFPLGTSGLGKRLEEIIKSKTRAQPKLHNISVFENQETYHFHLGEVKNTAEMDGVLESIKASLHPNRIELFHN